MAEKSSHAFPPTVAAEALAHGFRHERPPGQGPSGGGTRGLSFSNGCEQSVLPASGSPHIVSCPTCIGRRDLGAHVVHTADAARRVLHVRLARAEIDVSKEHIAQEHVAPVGRNERDVAGARARLRWRQTDPPDAVRGDSLGRKALAIEARHDCHSRRAKAPEQRRVWSALKHHPVAQGVGEFQQCVRERGKQEEGRESHCELSSALLAQGGAVAQSVRGRRGRTAGEEASYPP
eukprot:scaffold145650_cov36-Tisochrysis_lutea.AAC.1